MAGINLAGGTIEVFNDGSLNSTFFYLNGTADPKLIIDHSTATISAPDDTINGIDVIDGGVFIQDQASVSASQLHLEADATGTTEPFLLVSASSLDITGTGTVEGLSFSGLWLADGATDIADSSHVTTPELELDSPAVAESG